MSGDVGEPRTRWALRLARDVLAPGKDPLRRRYARRGLAAAVRRRLPESIGSRLVGRRSAGSSRYAAGFPAAWRDKVLDQPSAVCVVVDTAFPSALRCGAAPDGGDAWDAIILERRGSRREVRDADWANVVRLDAPEGLEPGWTLAALAHSGLLDTYEAVLHLGSAEAAELASPAVANRILRSVRADPGTGLVAVAVERSGESRAGRRRVGDVLSRAELDVPSGTWISPAGTSFWSRGFLLQGLRALDIPVAELVSDHTTAELLPVLGALAKEAGCRVESVADVAETPHQPSGRPRARIVPFYLPQFHPTAENDRWWGRGFTEWTNVTAAKPVYTGHRQPRLPRDLGFYDLRLDDTRRAQAELARSHGVEGFLYYHYWFSGRRVLEAPLDALVAGEVDSPFAIMWANENWTRTWDGGESSVLLEQDYSAGAAADFIEDALLYLRDPRYLRIDGRALLSVYRAGRIPDLASVVAAWRRRAGEFGIKLYVIAVDVPEAFGGLEGEPKAHGVDAVMSFPPHRYHRAWASTRGREVDPRFEGNLWSYSALVREDEARLRQGLPPDHYPTVMAGFDNTPRRQWSSMVFMGVNPYTFRRWLATAVEALMPRPFDQRVVFVNAWNEWAEGAVMEPDDRFGRSFLHAVRDVVGGQTS